MRGGFEEFVLAFGGGGCGAGEECADLGLVERFEGACGFEGLVEDLRVVDAGDDNGDWLRESVVEGFDGLDGVAFEDDKGRRRSSWRGRRCLV